MMLQGLALMAARFLTYYRNRSERACRREGTSSKARAGAMLCLAVAVENLERAAGLVMDRTTTTRHKRPQDVRLP
jgi:hypothetical protein